MFNKIVLVVTFFCCAYSQFSNAATYSSNRLFQNWKESELGFASAIGQSGSIVPGNGRNLAWTQMPKIRSYGEMYQVTKSTDWLDKMEESLDKISEYKETGIQCYGLMLEGWRDSSTVSGQQLYRYFPVHQGRILTGYLEFSKLVYDDPALTLQYGSKAEEYADIAEDVINSFNNLYDTKTVGGETVGYYTYPEQDKVNCSQVITSQKIGPYNQSLAIGIAMNLLYSIGRTSYQTKIEELANSIKADLSVPASSEHYEWHYWPSFSPSFLSGDTKAEDNGHAQIDVEFMYVTHKNGLGGVTKTDMARFAATMTNVQDQGHDFFAFRVDGSQNTKVSNHGKTNDMRRGWVLLAEYNSSILEIAERWCVNNTSHTNATLLRFGGQGMSCPGWCPKASNATFDSNDAKGWVAGHPQCDYDGSVVFDDKDGVDPLHDPDAQLNARKGSGYIVVSEQGSSNHLCDDNDPNDVIYKDIAIYKDISLLGIDKMEFAGFSRSLSSNSNHNSITNRSILAINTANNNELLSSVSESFSHSNDSLWRPFNVEIDTTGVTNVRAVVGMRDNWSTNWNQELRADELRVCVSEYCGDGICSVVEGEQETVASCVLDCDATLTNNDFNFDTGAQGWRDAGVNGGYIYSSAGGKLSASEGSSSATYYDVQGAAAATKDRELAWYQDFTSNQNALIVGGEVSVSSQYENSTAVNHFCVLVLDASASGMPELANRCSNWTYTKNSGPFKFEYDFTDQVANVSNIRIIVGTEDRWLTVHEQKLDIEYLTVKGATVAVSSCGNNICEIDEAPTSCPSDCGNSLATESYDFQSGAQGWQNTGSVGYSYVSSNDELVSEEIAGGGQGSDPANAAGMELNWYKDFDYTSGLFSVAGDVRVTSTYSGSTNVTRYCLVLMEVGANSVTELAGGRKCEEWSNTTDSGWWPFDEDFTGVVQENSQIRVVIGSPDGWSANHHQKVRIDNVTVTHGEMP